MIDKQRLWAIMRPQIADIIDQWDSEGIIIETQFVFASQNIIDHSSRLAYELIVENGGHEVIDADDGEISVPIAAAQDFSQNGWMYYFYDPTMMEPRTAEKIVRNYFQKHSNVFGE